LAVECHAYLAPFECHTIYFIKALVQGVRKFVHCDKIRYLSIPHYEGLGIKEILSEASRYPETEQYLPEEDEFKRLPRQWLINVAYTIIGTAFSDWAQERIEARNKKLVEVQKLAIDIDPEILRCFHASKTP
jgi:hypothetical protein